MLPYFSRVRTINPSWEEEQKICLTNWKRDLGIEKNIKCARPKYMFSINIIYIYLPWFWNFCFSLFFFFSESFIILIFIFLCFLLFTFHIWIYNLFYTDICEWFKAGAKFYIPKLVLDRWTDKWRYQTDPTEFTEKFPWCPSLPPSHERVPYICIILSLIL